MRFNFEQSSGRAYCRLVGPKCLCGTKGNGKIPKNTLCLKIHVNGARGGCTAFYCRECMINVIYNIKEALHNAGF